jgi:hypothetical protein
MAWYIWVVLFIALVGAAWLWRSLNRDTTVVSCIGCGRCAATGECVYVKEAKKARLTTEKNQNQNPVGLS